MLDPAACWRKIGRPPPQVRHHDRCAAAGALRPSGQPNEEVSMSTNGHTMTGFTAKPLDEMEAIHGGAVKLVAAELGVESFGMQVLDFPPAFPNYPEHDHSDDG